MSPTTSIQHRFNQEAKIFYAFTKRDMSATFLPATIFAFPAFKQIYHGNHQHISSLIHPTIFLQIWLLLYLYSFNIENQIYSVEEDRINKPDRPLPSGMVTLQGAKIRWVALTSLFFLTGLFNQDVFLPCLVWKITTVLLCFTPCGAHWLYKNPIAMTLGTWSLLEGASRIVAPFSTTSKAQAYIVSLSLWVGMLSQTQDFRDVVGDRNAGRYTFPIAFGDSRSRWIHALVFCPLGLASIWRGGILQMAPISLTVAHIVVAYRTVIATGKNDRDYDNWTYAMVVYTFSYLLSLISYNSM